jgi:ubiquinone/menaquinone biosynthesis C-methylase UbiE
MNYPSDLMEVHRTGDTFHMAISFDRVAERYDTTRGLPDEVMKDILATFEKIMSRDTLILDAGVGTGRFALPLQERGFEVVGIDVSSKMLAKAREKGVRNLFQGDLCSLPFMDSSFQFTLSVHVLHLIKNWRCALGEIGRVTTDEFLSVLSEKENSPAQEIRKAYEEACRQLGYEVRHVGMRERELPDVLPPDTYRNLLVYEHTMEVDNLLDGFEDRLFSNLWSVPEEVHQRAIEVIREQFEGVETLLEVEDIKLASWSAQKLRNYCSL